MTAPGKPLDLDGMEGIGSSRDHDHTASVKLDGEWEAAAEAIAKAVEARIADPLKLAAEKVYLDVMEATQEYLADNARFNIGSRLQSADRARRAQWERAEAAERLASELLAALKAVVAVADRKTDVFDAAHAVIAKALGEQPL